MSDTTDRTAPTRGFWVVAWLALVWNLLGIVTYLMSVTQSPEALAAMPEAERALYEGIPAWVTSAYAIAVFSGTIAALALLLRKSWAVPVFVVSLIAILIQMGHALFGSALIAVRGPSAAVLPLVIVVIAIYLVWFSRSARTKGWIG